MRDFLKNRLGTVLILIATLVLAGIAIFTAIRLYQLRQQAVAPTAPTSRPRAAGPVACTAFSFAVSAATLTPTPTPTATATAAPTATPTKTPTAAPTATQAALPQAGTEWPTLVGAGIGILLIIGSLLLAL